MEEFNDPGNRKVGEAKKYQEVVESKSQNSRQRPLLAALEEIMSTTASNAPFDDGRTVKEYELQQVERANKTGLQPVVFVHGLWLLPSSWDRWAAAFEEAGFTALTPGWPDDPETVAEANAHPEGMAH